MTTSDTAQEPGTMGSKASSLSRFIKDNLVVAFVLLAVLFVDLFVLYLLQEKVRGIRC